MNTAQKQFVRVVYDYYSREGRHDLPWRKTVDPYAIAVSEIMLQQTQAQRVKEKYRLFLKAFPTAKKLARAPLAEVLALWSGLGYNRRAKFLHQMASVVVRDYKGKFPVTIEGLQTLPGIGPYTAGAIAAFAYNAAYPMIETNIRTVYLHHFFRDGSGVSDSQITPIIEATLDKVHPREWYWALMDYGSFLKSRGIASHRVSKHYTKQSAFKGSRRQIRGGILRELLKAPATVNMLSKIIEREKEDIVSVLNDLVQEDLVKKNGMKYTAG